MQARCRSFLMGRSSQLTFGITFFERAAPPSRDEALRQIYVLLHKTGSANPVRLLTKITLPNIGGSEPDSSADGTDFILQ